MRTEQIVVNTDKLIRKGKKSKIPGSVDPMLCTLTKEVIEDEKYLYELKWDGYRTGSFLMFKKER
jgi:bifunctional non-homologous end joining protein LigD